MSLRNTLIIAIASFSLLSACSDDGDGKKAPDSAVVGDSGGGAPDSNTGGDMSSVPKDGSQTQKDKTTPPPKDGGPTQKDAASGCGKIPLTIGCCDGEVLTWCEEDGKGGYQVKTYDCTKNKLPKCGWSGFSTQAYACATKGDPDPSGTHPKACP